MVIEERFKYFLGKQILSPRLTARLTSATITSGKLCLLGIVTTEYQGMKMQRSFRDATTRSQGDSVSFHRGQYA